MHGATVKTLKITDKKKFSTIQIKQQQEIKLKIRGCKFTSGVKGVGALK